MQSIITRYYGATNTKPSCIRAWTSGNPSKKHRFSYEHGLNADGNHRAAAKALASHLQWAGTWFEGSLDSSSYVYVCATGKRMNAASSFTIAE